MENKDKAPLIGSVIFFVGSVFLHTIVFLVLALMASKIAGICDELLDGGKLPATMMLFTNRSFLLCAYLFFIAVAAVNSFILLSFKTKITAYLVTFACLFVFVVMYVLALFMPLVYVIEHLGK